MIQQIIHNYKTNVVIGEDDASLLLLEVLEETAGGNDYIYNECKAGRPWSAQMCNVSLKGDTIYLMSLFPGDEDLDPFPIPHKHFLELYKRWKEVHQHPVDGVIITRKGSYFTLSPL